MVNHRWQIGAKINTIKGTILTADDMTDQNTFAKPNLIEPLDFNQAKIEQNIISVQLPPMSVVVLELIK